MVAIPLGMAYLQGQTVSFRECIIIFFTPGVIRRVMFFNALGFMSVIRGFSPSKLPKIITAESVHTFRWPHKWSDLYKIDGFEFVS